jgi:hypothetical protein
LAWRLRPITGKIEADTDGFDLTPDQARIAEGGLQTDVIERPSAQAANLAEEIDSLGKSDRRALTSHLINLLL